MIAWIKGRIACWRGNHDYRQPRKAEDQSAMHCKRCAATRPIKHRKPKEQS